MDLAPVTGSAGWANNSNTQVGDFNGDGKTDLLVPNPVSGTWDVALSDGARLGAPGNGQWLTDWTTFPQWSGVRDFNGDVNSDLIATHGDGRYAVALSDGTRLGELGPSVWLAEWDSNSNAQVGDFNGDAKADLLVPNPDSGAWDVALSDGTRLGAAGSGHWLTGWTTTPQRSQAM